MKPNKLYLGRLPRRGENKKVLWEQIKVFCLKDDSKSETKPDFGVVLYRVNVCRPSANKLGRGAIALPAKLLAPAYSQPIIIGNHIVKNVGARGNTQKSTIFTTILQLKAPALEEQKVGSMVPQKLIFLEILLTLSERVMFGLRIRFGIL